MSLKLYKMIEKVESWIKCKHIVHPESLGISLAPIHIRQTSLTNIEQTTIQIPNKYNVSKYVVRASSPGPSLASLHKKNKYNVSKYVVRAPSPGPSLASLNTEWKLQRVLHTKCVVFT
jgi:hypothetical protein